MQVPKKTGTRAQRDEHSDYRFLRTISRASAKFFAGRTSKLRAETFGGIAAFLGIWGGVYYNNRHVPPWIAALIFFVGGIFGAFASRQIAINHRKTDLIANIWLGFVIMVVSIFTGLNLFFEYHSSHPKGAAIPPFLASVHTTAAWPAKEEDLSNSQYWIVRSIGGIETASPIHYVLNIEFTNLKQVPVIISSYSIETEVAGKWRAFPVIDLRGGTLWHRMTAFTNSQRLEVTDFNTVVDGKRIEPGEPVRGFIFLEIPPGGKGPKTRFTVKYATGEEYTQPFNPQKPLNAIIQQNLFHIKEIRDISKMRRAFYSNNKPSINLKPE